jgi:hypothetical protein
MFSNILISAAAWLGFVGVTTAASNAETLLARTRIDAGISGGATYLVDFNGPAAGGTQFNFSTQQANVRVVIFFNAECAVEGEETRYVDLDIVVNPAGPAPEAAVPPTDGDNAFCSGNGTTTAGGGDFTLDGWVSAAMIAPLTLPQAGTHTIKVRIHGGAAGITRLDDLSLVVMR